MDFIEELPNSNGFMTILVVTNRSSKQGIFIPTTNKIKSEELAYLFLIHVIAKHGVPQHVTSDRGSEFISAFMRSLGKLLHMTMHYTSGYHPQANGQTERANQTLEQYICCYCAYKQDNWDRLLPLAEFAYNNTPNASTGLSPFFANKGYHPNLTVYPERDLASQRARDFAVDLDGLHKFLRIELTRATRYKEVADCKRLPDPEMEVGSTCYMSAEHISTTRPTEKFREAQLGPFTILSKPSAHSYELKLPPYLSRVHPVFHVSALEPAYPNTILNRVQPPPPPVEVKGNEAYEVAKVLNSKLDKCFRGLRRYRYYV